MIRNKELLRLRNTEFILISKQTNGLQFHSIQIGLWCLSVLSNLWIWWSMIFSKNHLDSHFNIVLQHVSDQHSLLWTFTSLVISHWREHRSSRLHTLSVHHQLIPSCIMTPWRTPVSAVQWHRWTRGWSQDIRDINSSLFMSMLSPPKKSNKSFIFGL